MNGETNLDLIVSHSIAYTCVELVKRLPGELLEIEVLCRLDRTLEG